MEEDITSNVLHMLQSIRVFGLFDKPVFLDLWRHGEIINLCAGLYLYNVGDPDENI
jgi:lysophospholipid hydrolase